jgi:hypothetical protein
MKNGMKINYSCADMDICTRKSKRTEGEEDYLSQNNLSIRV